jgi:hypothetical protein
VVIGGGNDARITWTGSGYRLTVNGSTWDFAGPVTFLPGSSKLKLLNKNENGWVLRIYVERLGYPAETRALILNCDDLGMCRAASRGCELALREGLATSASLMVPCTDARAAAARTADLDVGVHLTVNCEWPAYPWGPLTEQSSLGPVMPRFPRHLTAVDPVDVRAELRAQITQALQWGVDVTHLDAHMYVAHEMFLEVYLDLACEFRLPVRLGGSGRQQASARGIVAPDYLVPLTKVGSRDDLVPALRNLRVGVTEFHAHPAVDDPQLHEIAADWPGRVDDLALYTGDDFRELVRASGAVLIGYRELREVYRSRR